ncbi:hypothetical protein LCGC14_0893640 [marine sediment metagenome]|uniref:Uncharacterized protein n=1 Tax=marine sediment metagenome TaxID=412755 RepID=A0A0F9NYJ1_9ZZZZ
MKKLSKETLQGMKKQELLDYCRSNGIKGYSNKNKTYITNLILQSYKTGKQPIRRSIRKVTITKKQSIILNFTKTYHGTIHKNVSGVLLKGLDVSKSRGKGFGIYNSISVTDNPLLAKSMIKGELGLDKKGEILIINKRLRIIDLRDIKGRKYWKSLDRNPIKATKENIDGVAFKNYESIRIKAFYKDIPLNKVKNALEIQIFKSIEPRYIKIINLKKGVENYRKFNFTILSKKYLKKYSRDEKLPENYFIINEKRTGKFILNKKGAETWAVRKGKWITINPQIFEAIAEENPNDAEKMLSFIIAHEVSHYKSKIEAVADIKATLISKISEREFRRLEQKYQKKLIKFKK